MEGHVTDQSQGHHRVAEPRHTLTIDEVQAARTATYFETGLWGNPQKGWSPEAVVAQIRGVVFQPDTYGFYSPNDAQAAQHALEDVAAFLGFSDQDAYLNAVMSERGAVIVRFFPSLS